VADATKVFFHERQLEFKPRYEWAFGEKITHPETTTRAEAILAALEREPLLFDVRTPDAIPFEALRALHSYQLLTLYSTAEQLAPERDWHPTVFPKLARGQGDPTNLHHAGAWCFDSGTPLNASTLEAAGWSAGCAREAAAAVREGARLAYALSRPPGHHAEEDMFGGYCYFNNSAVAARELHSAGARVAVLDIDFHHGNGTQSLFNSEPEVLTISLHGDPRDHFPFYTGYPRETGKGAGSGYNLNLVLDKGADGQAYLEVLEHHAITSLEHFDPDFIVLAAGLDGYEKDPIGDFALTTHDFYRIGERIGALGRPIAAIQEGGYYTPHLGHNAVALLRGLRAGLGIEG
jgi:acetoin utilization deacetylase AcuC-like enzyme